MRTSHKQNLSLPALEAILRTAFGSASIEGDAVVASFGAISRLAARPSGRELSIDLAMNPKVPLDVAGETIRRYNQFLETATGFSSKERSKRLRKWAGEGGSGG